MSDQDVPPEERRIIPPGPARDNGEPEPVIGASGDMTITVTIKATPSPQGYKLHIDATGNPFYDTIIDLCLRAARFYERHATIAQANEMQAKVQQVTGMVRDLERGGHGAAPFRRFHG